MPIVIRAAMPADHDAIADILLPMIRAGETYPLPRDMTREQALAYWFTPGHEVFVAEDGGVMVGTYYLRPNQRGGGGPVANCGYVTSRAAEGSGVGRTMCEHSLARAMSRGFRLWQSCGFEIVGRLPAAFHHPTHEFVDVFVMMRSLV